jgi:Protein of unknown function (DUF664)
VPDVSGAGPRGLTPYSYRQHAFPRAANGRYVSYDAVMDIDTVLAEAFDRIAEEVHSAVDGLTPTQLRWQPPPDGNSVAWLVWHLTRIQDDHLADVAGIEQAWTAQDWFDRFELPFPAAATGYGHGPSDVAAVRVDSAQLLTGYHDAVHKTTRQYLASLKPADLDRVVDQNYQPPVTLGVRLISVISDDLQHVGQAAYVRGLL